MCSLGESPPNHDINFKLSYHDRSNGTVAQSTAESKSPEQVEEEYFVLQASCYKYLKSTGN